MKIMKHWVYVFVVVFTVGCGGDQDPPVCLDEYSTDYHMVLFRCNADYFVSLATRVGGTVERVHKEIGLAKVSGLSDRAIRRLKRSRVITSIGTDVEVDWLRERIDEPVETDGGSATRVKDHEDPTSAAFYNVFQWNMKTIGCSDAWPIEQGDESVRVAIVDSGISADHIDLDGRYDIATSINLTNSNTVDVEDQNGHGTQIAGIISTNNVFIAGLAPHTTLIGVKVLEEDGTGNLADLIAGIMYAVNSADADIINISFGSHFSSNFYLCNSLATSLTGLKRAVRYANRKGVLVVAAAGDGDDMFMGMNLDEQSGQLHLPSQFNHVIAVGATAPVNQADFDSLTSYSNHGMTAIDIVAPGGNDLLVDGTFLDGVMTAVAPPLVNGSTNRFNTTSGTGVAAAHVSGLAALISAHSGESMSPAELWQHIIDTSDDLGEAGRDALYGHGRINVHRAVTE